MTVDYKSAVEYGFREGLLSLRAMTHEETEFVRLRLRGDLRRDKWKESLATDPKKGEEYARWKADYQKRYMKEWRAGKRRGPHPE